MNHDTHTAVMRMLCSWLLVGVSQMTPLQVVQAAAAVTATIYTVLQILVLISDRWKRWRERE